MRRLSIAALLALATILGLVVFSGTSADEGTINLRASLTGFQEVAPKLTNGTGTFTATITGGQLNYTLTYSNLSSPAFMAHIHFGQKAVNGGVFIWLCQSPSALSPTAGTPTCPAGGGTVTGTANAASVVKITGQTLSSGDFNDALAIIRSGEAYANVHTTNFPLGEIRGQITIADD